MKRCCFSEWSPIGTAENTALGLAQSHPSHSKGNDFFPACNLPALAGLENVWKGCRGAERLNASYQCLAGACAPPSRAHPARVQSLPKPFPKASSSAPASFCWPGAKCCNLVQSIKEDLLWGQLPKPRNITLLRGEGSLLPDRQRISANAAHFCASGIIDILSAGL